MTVFHVPGNNVASTVAASRAAGSATLAVEDGTRFGIIYPIIVTVARGPLSAETVLCILNVTARVGNALTVSGAIEGTADAAMVVGDRVEMRPTALAITEIHAAVNVAEATIAATISDRTYVHAQAVPSASWTITHNLGKRPSVTVVDSADSVVVGDVTYLSANSVRVDFSGGFAGNAYLN